MSRVVILLRIEDKYRHIRRHFRDTIIFAPRKNLSAACAVVQKDVYTDLY